MLPDPVSRGPHRGGMLVHDRRHPLLLPFKERGRVMLMRKHCSDMHGWSVRADPAGRAPGRRPGRPEL
jgi:hypothetical protein